MKYENSSLFLVHDLYGSVVCVNPIYIKRLSVLWATCTYYINVQPILKCNNSIKHNSKYMQMKVRCMWLQVVHSLITNN